MDFNALHQQNQPLLLANVWDASSAQAAQQAGYQALGSSSAAIAAMLGYEDGEEMSFDELFYVVSRIKTVSELPLSVDLEAGYGATTSHIIDGDAGNLKIDKYRPGAPFSMAGDSIQHALFAIFGEIH
ncbi:carboxyvinyl-carboxyphosphonate phosphorylmutase [Klebsiella pneumoniae]|nr:carboxyvinyl-carboxyphosphonate phosphorylmutase [Klebsiella pneumoniae]